MIASSLSRSSQQFSIKAMLAKGILFIYVESPMSTKRGPKSPVCQLSWVYRNNIKNTFVCLCEITPVMISNK